MHDQGLWTGRLGANSVLAGPHGVQQVRAHAEPGDKTIGSPDELVVGIAISAREAVRGLST
jgi:hypothetical protein